MLSVTAVGDTLHEARERVHGCRPHHSRGARTTAATSRWRLPPRNNAPHRLVGTVSRATWKNVRVSVPNVLAERYASPAMRAIWAPESKIVAERRLWIAVMRAQAAAGLDISDATIADYEARVGDVDLASIAGRERVTKHDVKARIEEFNALAGHESIHLGMTSRDLTENVEQMQLRKSMELIRDKSVASLTVSPA